MACECNLVTGLTVGGENQGTVGTKVGDPAMPKLVQVFRCFTAGKQIVIVNIDRLIGVLCCFSGRTELLADSAAWSYKLRRFSVSVVFNICGQSIFYQSGGTGGRRRSDKSRM